MNVALPFMFDFVCKIAAKCLQIFFPLRFKRPALFEAQVSEQGSAIERSNIAGWQPYP